jgi:hypothetical protein
VSAVHQRDMAMARACEQQLPNIRIFLQLSKVRRRNSSHLAGSCWNQLRNSVLGATSLIQASSCNCSFFTLRGHTGGALHHAHSSAHLLA